MKKLYVMILIGTIFSFIGFSQTVKQKIEKEIQNPQRKENAGKADVIISQQKNIFDSTTFRTDSKETVEKKVTKTSVKKLNCKKKAKK